MSVDNLTTSLSKLTVKQLVSHARAAKLKNYSNLRKKELVAKLSITPSLQSSLRSADLTGAKTTQTNKK
jgi:hypothetical protein